MVDDCHLPEAHGSEENVGPVKREVALHAYTCNIKKECGSPHSKIYNTFWRTAHKDITFFMLHAHKINNVAVRIQDLKHIVAHRTQRSFIFYVTRIHLKHKKNTVAVAYRA